MAVAREANNATATVAVDNEAKDTYYENEHHYCKG